MPSFPCGVHHHHRSIIPMSFREFCDEVHRDVFPSSFRNFQWLEFSAWTESPGLAADAWSTCAAITSDVPGHLWPPVRSGDQLQGLPPRACYTCPRILVESTRSPRTPQGLLEESLNSPRTHEGVIEIEYNLFSRSDLGVVKEFLIIAVLHKDFQGASLKESWRTSTGFRKSAEVSFLL